MVNSDEAKASVWNYIMDVKYDRNDWDADDNSKRGWNYQMQHPPTRKFSADKSTDSFKLWNCWPDNTRRWYSTSLNWEVSTEPLVFKCKNPLTEGPAAQKPNGSDGFANSWICGARWTVKTAERFGQCPAYGHFFHSACAELRCPPKICKGTTTTEVTRWGSNDVANSDALGITDVWFKQMLQVPVNCIQRFPEAVIPILRSQYS